MSAIQHALGLRVPTSGPGRLAGRPRGPRIEAIPGWHDELEMAALRLAYEDDGGIARGDEIGRRLAARGPCTFVSAAQLLANQEVFGFQWQGSPWIPMFQFTLTDLSIKADVRKVREALGDGFDGWALSAWFVESNAWLGSCRPLDLIESHLDAVLHAARADRFVATG